MLSKILIPLVAAALPPQDESPGGWVPLQLPTVTEPSPEATIPAAHLDGRHLIERIDDAASPREPRRMDLPASLLVQLLEDQSRAAGARRRARPGAPPRVVRGSDAALQTARETVLDLAGASKRLAIRVEAALAPVGAGVEEPPQDAERFSVETRSSRRVFLGARESVPYLSTFEVEVSSDSGVADPVVGRVDTGRTLHLTAYRIDDGRGVYLHGVLDLAQLESMTEADLETTDLGTIQRPSVASCLVVFSAVARPGETVRVSVKGTPLDPPNWSLWLKAETEATPRNAAERGFDLTDVSFIASTTPELPPIPLGPSRDDRFLGSTVGRGFPGVPASAIASAASMSESGRSAGAAFYAAKGLLLSDRSKPALAQEARNLIAAYESPRLATASVAFTRGELRVLLPVTANAAARVVIGRETSYVADYDVEIAHDIWMPSPDVRRRFDGLLFDAQLVAGELRCAASATRSSSLDELPVEKAHLGRLELPSATFASASGSLSKDTPERRLRLGSDASSDLSIKFLVR